MKYVLSLLIVCVFIVSVEGIGFAQRCRRSGGGTAASASPASSSGSRAVAAPVCGSGTTILGTPGVSGRISTHGDDTTEHRWKGGSYKHLKRTHR